VSDALCIGCFAAHFRPSQRRPLTRHPVLIPSRLPPAPWPPTRPSQVTSSPPPIIPFPVALLASTKQQHQHFEARPDFGLALTDLCILLNDREPLPSTPPYSPLFWLARLTRKPSDNRPKQHPTQALAPRPLHQPPSEPPFSLATDTPRSYSSLSPFFYLSRSLLHAPNATQHLRSHPPRAAIEPPQQPTACPGHPPNPTDTT
jgi:hypothetical protein